MKTPWLLRVYRRLYYPVLDYNKLKPLYYKSPMKRNESMIWSIHLQNNYHPSSRSSSRVSTWTICSSNWRLKTSPHCERVATTQPNIGKTNIHRPLGFFLMMLGRFLSFPFKIPYFSGVKVETHAPSQPSSNNRDTNIHQWICSFHPT